MPRTRSPASWRGAQPGGGIHTIQVCKATGDAAGVIGGRCARVPPRHCFHTPLTPVVALPHRCSCGGTAPAGAASARRLNQGRLLHGEDQGRPTRCVSRGSPALGALLARWRKHARTHARTHARRPLYRAMRQGHRCVGFAAALLFAPDVPPWRERTHSAPPAPWRLTSRTSRGRCMTASSACGAWRRSPSVSCLLATRCTAISRVGDSLG